MTIDQKQAQLDELLATSVDGAASPELFAEIEQLLLDDPALQRYYAQWMSLQVQLQVEYSLLGYEVPSAAGRLALATERPLDAADCHALAERIERDVRGDWRSRTTVRRAIAWGAIATALLVTTGGLLLSRGGREATPVARELVPQETFGSVAPKVAGATVGSSSATTFDLGTSLGKPGAYPRTLKNVNPVSWPGLQLASFAYRTSRPAPPRQGPLELDDFFKQNAKGYVMVLEPGCQLDLIVDAYSDSKNQLVLLELGADGAPNGRIIAFNNKTPDEQANTNKRMGRLGRWSDFNATDAPRYYLLAGFHTIVTGGEESGWRLSRFAVGYQSKNFLQVGWDDSYVSQRETTATLDTIADSDFDDLIATARITNLEAVIDTPSSVQFTPASTLSEQLEVGSHEYPLVVQPGETVLIRCASSALNPNSLTVVEQGTRKVVWTHSSDRNLFPSDTKRLLGISMIENFTSAPQTYLLVGGHLEYRSTETRWKRSAFQVKTDLDGFVQVGMEDGADIDFDDVLVDIEWGFR